MRKSPEEPVWEIQEMLGKIIQRRRVSGTELTKGVTSSCSILSRLWQTLVVNVWSGLAHGLFTTPTPRKCTLHLRDFYPRVRRFLANLRPQKSPEHSEEAALEHFPSAWVSSPQNLFSPAPQADPELLSTAIRQPALHLKKIFKTYSHSQNCKLLFASYIPNQLPPDTLVGEFPCFLNPIGGVS